MVVTLLQTWQERRARQQEQEGWSLLSEVLEEPVREWHKTMPALRGAPT